MKITDYSSLNSPANNDVLPVVDVDDLTMSQAGTTKNITIAELMTMAPQGGGGVQIAGDLGGSNNSPTVISTHLSAPLPVNQGGTGQITASAALAALGGASVAGDIGGSSASPTVAKIQGTAIAAPSGGSTSFLNATGAWAAPQVPSLTFTYGVAGGPVPSSGTYATDTVVVDQKNILRVCTAGGTPGTWRRVGADSDMFYLDDYCVGDFQQALVTVTSGAPTVINTTPISAVQAVQPPTIANSGSNGTILAGVYQAEITYVNKWGETTASSSVSTTTTGSTSTITVTPPNTAISLNASGWKLYLTGPGGATFWLQGGVRALNVPVTLTAPPVTSGSNPPGSDTTAAQVFTSTAVDGGKDFIINGGAAAGVTAPTVGNIVTVNSSTQATINVTNGNTIAVSTTGIAFAFATDDRLNVDQCISDATAYALANNYIARIIGGPKMYSVGQSFFQSTEPPSNGTFGEFTYNTQVRIPAPNPSGNTQKLDFQILFPGDSGFNQFWMSYYPNVTTGFFSFAAGETLGSDSTYGDSSVVGGPQGGSGTGSNGFFNVNLTVKGMQTWHPGWANTIGLDMKWLSGCKVHSGGSFAFAPATDFSGSGKVINPVDQWITNSFWKNHTSIGIRPPYQNNNEYTVIDSWVNGGVNTGMRCQGEGLVINKIMSVGADVATYIDSPGGNPGHNMTIRNFHWENCNGGISVASGSSANWLQVEIVMDSELSGPAYDLNDPNNVLRGTIFWADTFRNPSIPIVNGGAGVRFINATLKPGHWGSALGNAPAAPSVPGSGTALATSVSPYRDASIVLHTGSGVTVSAITMDGTSTGLTMAASSNLVLPVLPSGKVPTLTYSGGTPSWDWWLL